MIELITIILSIVSILVWTSIFRQTFSTTEGFRYKLHFARTLIEAVNFPPLNCRYCISFWLGLVLSITFVNVFYMVIFLYFAFIEGNDLLDWCKEQINKF